MGLNIKKFTTNDAEYLSNLLYGMSRIIGKDVKDGNEFVKLTLEKDTFEKILNSVSIETHKDKVHLIVNLEEVVPDKVYTFTEEKHRYKGQEFNKIYINKVEDTDDIKCKKCYTIEALINIVNDYLSINYFVEIPRSIIPDIPVELIRKWTGVTQEDAIRFQRGKVKSIRF